MSISYVTDAKLELPEVKCGTDAVVMWRLNENRIRICQGSGAVILSAQQLRLLADNAEAVIRDTVGENGA